MTDWRKRLPDRTVGFAEGLEAAGFEPTETRHRWHGDVDGRRITVTIGDDFPFYPPKVRLDPPPDALTWHLERDGAMCLYTPAGKYGLPWAEAPALLRKVREWLDNADSGWPNDLGEPDLERYFEAADDPLLVTYDDIDGLVGHIMLEERINDAWIHVRRGGRLTRQYARDKLRNPNRDHWAYGADLGLLREPVWDWQSIRSRIEIPSRLVELVSSSNLTGLLLLRYERDGSEGRRTAAVALRVRGGAEPQLHWLPVAEDSPAARRRVRAGPDADVLGRKTVALVGCGAVGSFLADLLARCGVGWLILVDDDYLRPSNCIRHLAPVEYVPLPKAVAVRDVLHDRAIMDRELIDARYDRLTLEHAIRLFKQADVVVDATADPSVDEILHHVAHQAGEQYVRVSVHRDGDLVRVDRLGPGSADPAHRPDVIEPRDDAGTPYREVGCGDPVSPAAPWAATEAANVACRWVVDALRPRRRRQLPNSTVEVLRPQLDAPYREIGTRT